MAKSCSTKMSLEQGLRGWAKLLLLWRLCGNAGCRRARVCRGAVHLCIPANFPPLPEGVRDWFMGLAEAREQELSFEEAMDRLEAMGANDALRDWNAAVRASVMGYSLLCRRRGEPDEQGYLSSGGA